MTKVLVWAEERPEPHIAQRVKETYPEGIHNAIAGFLSKKEGLSVRAATMDDEEFGLSEESLAWADAMVYWSHKAWRDLPEEVARRVQTHVLNGLGVIFLHSANASKPFTLLMGTRTACHRWRLSGDRQVYWLVAPEHRIADGLNREFFELPCDETFCEYFEIPQPDELVFITGTPGCEVFRSGCCWRRGQGRVFYLSAGHEEYPVYHQAEIQLVILNAVFWCARPSRRPDWPDWARRAVQPGEDNQGAV